MIESINKLFGIENEISVPIIISLIVFIIGGFSRLLLNSINNYFTRLQNRNSFRNIIEEIIRKCQQKSNHLKLFYPTLNIEYNDDWSLKFTKVTYLELVFQQDLNTVFNSFRILFKFRNEKKLRLKAYNKIWAYLENLKFWENRILLDLEKFHQKFNKHETAYYSHLEELRKENDKTLQPLVGKKIDELGFPENVFNYIMKRDKIFDNWQNIDEATRTQRTILLNSLVKPLYKLNMKNQDVNLIIEQNTILLAAMHEYDQMKKTISVENQLFFDYNISYRCSYRMLLKCLKIIN
jgi:hypothetical protein